MGITTRTIPAIANGVSKQPPILRSADQTEEELNTWGEVASGVSRRPPTEIVAELSASALDTVFIHHINRDETERYLVLIDSGYLKVFDTTTGAEKTVSAPDGLGYLSSAGSSYRAVTVADYTFIINTDVECALAAVAADQTAQPTHYVFPGGNGSAASTGSTLALAGDQYQYDPNPTVSALTGTKQKFSDLPATPSVGDTYRIEGSDSNGFVSYYVRWSGSVWDETVAPGLKNAIDATTMPHALVRQADGTFLFSPFSWQPRRMGDTETNPNPPFIGRKLRDVFFYKNRLGFLVDESAVFSAAGDYGEFWRKTVLDYVDSDTLAVSSSTTDVALLDYAVPFNDGMMLFSAQRQFSLSNGQSGLSAASIEINPVTGYAMARGVRPVTIGSQVYFASNVSGYTAIQEYTRLDGTDATAAAEVTAHVPDYLPSGVSQLIAAPDLKAVFALASGVDGGRYVYAYQFFWDGNEKILSAWRKWDFGSGAKVLAGSFLAGTLSLVIQRGTAVWLEKVRLGPGEKSLGVGHMLYLDRQTTVAGVYSAVTDTTSFALPYAPDQTSFRIIRGAGAASPESLISPTGYVFSSPTSVTVSGNESGVVMVVGEAYRTYLKFSRQYPQDYQMRPLSTGRLQLHTWTVTYANTAFFSAEVSPYGADAVINGGDTTYTSDFSGRITGAASLVVGQMAYHSGAYTFSVAGDAAQAVVALSNETPYASTWVSAEWEGLFFSRALGG